MSDKLQEVRNFLEETVKDKGFSLNSLSLQLGKNSTYLFHFIKRHSPRRLDEQTRHKLAQILEVSEQKLCDYPLGGGLIQDKLNTLSGLLGIGKEQSYPNKIKVVDMEGYYRGNFDMIRKNVIGEEYFSDEMIKYYGFTNINDVVIVKNSGDAMLPSINPDDMLWVDTSYNKALSDGIYLIEANNTVLLRRIQINPFNGSVDLIADNSSYKPYNIKNNSDLKTCGKVVFITHKL